MINLFSRLFGNVFSKNTIPEYLHIKSKLINLENGWIEILPFEKKDEVTIVLYGNSSVGKIPYHRLFIELSSSSEIRDFLEWINSDLSSLLYVNNRLYLETTVSGDKFIQITNHGYYKSWQWSLKMNKSNFEIVKSHIESNWTVSPFIVPQRKSINLKNPYSYSRTIVPLTNN